MFQMRLRACLKGLALKRCKTLWIVVCRLIVANYSLCIVCGYRLNTENHVECVCYIF